MGRRMREDAHLPGARKWPSLRISRAELAGLARHLAISIRARNREDTRLEWTRTGRVRVRTAAVLPPGHGFTMNARRQKLQDGLATAMVGSNWSWSPGGWWSPPEWVPTRRRGMSPEAVLARERAWLRSQGLDPARQLCGECGVVGVPPRSAHGGRTPCGCGVSPFQEEQIDLCYCCGLEPISGRQKRTRWFCPDCQGMAEGLNTERGRYVVPVGSLSLIGTEPLRDSTPEWERELFRERLRHVQEAVSSVSAWREVRAGELVAERWPRRRGPIPLPVFLLHSADDSFAEKARSFWRMLDYCQWWVRRGKSEVREA